jgi:HK97 family phage portal protein
VPIRSGNSVVDTKSTIIYQGDTAHYYGSWRLESGYRSTGYSEMYRRQLWVKVVIAKRAGMVKRLPLPVYRRDPQGRQRVPDHPYARLLRKPNVKHDRVTFWDWTSSTYDIFGEAFWGKIRDAGGRPVQLVPLHPTRMRDTDEGNWEYTSNDGTVTTIGPHDVVHFKTYNPDDMCRGLSPLEPLRETLENEGNARRATSSFWRNGARPGFVLGHPGNLSQPAGDRLRAQWEDMYAGAANTGKTVILEEGMTAQPLTIDSEKAQYIETRKLNREEVVAAYDMPPPAVHILDHATFSNITEQFRSLYRDTGPVLNYFEAVLEDQLRGSFRPGASSLTSGTTCTRSSCWTRCCAARSRPARRLPGAGLPDDRGEAREGEPAVHRRHGPHLHQRGDAAAAAPGRGGCTAASAVPDGRSAGADRRRCHLRAGRPRPAADRRVCSWSDSRSGHRPFSDGPPVPGGLGARTRSARPRGWAERPHDDRSSGTQRVCRRR